MSPADADRRFDLAIERIDAANRADPRTVEVDGETVAFELLYSRRMSRRLAVLEPGASEELRVAVRAQHLCRWRLARDSYPEGRQGYLAWRRACGAMHAELATEILSEIGYDSDFVGRVAELLQKKRMGSDAESQLLEDTACLVFLESYAPDFLAGRDDETAARVLRRTWRKMSARARRQVDTLELAAPVRLAVDRVLVADRSTGDN